MKNRKLILSLLLVLCLVFSFSPISMATEDSREGLRFDFDDAGAAPWAQGNIEKMQLKQVIKGYTDGTFKPNNPVKKIEAIVMAVRLMELEEEALAKSPDTPLHFKDANQIPSWAKGHVIVALEQGLFDLSEDKIQPDKPASRVWIVNLLVRAMDLQSAALSQMLDIPDFEDAHEIPAGSIGYVNVAINQGLLQGYDDNTFKPNRSVTRGEMAAFLDRTNDGLLEQSGAVIVQGPISAVTFDGVTDDVYGSDGHITIQSFGGDGETYAIHSEQYVQYDQGFIQAKQLLAGDIVMLIVQEGIVLEAYLIDHDQVNIETNLVELEIILKISHHNETKLKYKNKRGEVEAEYETHSGEQKERIKGAEAIAQVEEIIEQLSLNSDISEQELIQEVLLFMQVEEEQFKELEIKVKFSDGVKIEVELENDDHAGLSYNGIQEFEVIVKQTEKDKLKLKYLHKEGEPEAEVEIETETSKEKFDGSEAVESLQSLLNELALTEDMTQQQITEAILANMQIEANQLIELEIKVRFSNGEKIEIENDDEADEDDEDHEDDDEDDEDEDSYDYDDEDHDE